MVQIPLHSLLQKVGKFFDGYPDFQKKNICVALSGGADSVSLLLAMQMIARERGILLSACHFNHRIRGAESDRDQSFCEQLCRSFGITLFSDSYDVVAYSKKKSLSLEEGARQCRYEFFLSLVKNNGIELVATAHTLDDNAETVIFNLARGSGSFGGAGILPVRDIFIRPLLCVSREEVEDFLRCNNQSFVTDSTNKDECYSRNFIRAQIMPLLKRINPDVSTAIYRFSCSARNDRDYFLNEIKKYFQEDLRYVHPSVSHRVMYEIFANKIGRSPSYSEMQTMKNAIRRNGRTVIDFGGWDGVFENGRVGFFDHFESRVYGTAPISMGENIVFDGNVCIHVDDGIKNTKTFYKISTTDILSFDNIKGKLCVRSRHEGDRILINGVNKSVKKLFIDKKIPKEFRDMIPVFCDDGGIIYIPFAGVSDRVFSGGNGKIFVTTYLNCIDTERWRFAYETKK